MKAKVILAAVLSSVLVMAAPAGLSSALAAGGQGAGPGGGMGAGAGGGMGGGAGGAGAGAGTGTGTGAGAGGAGTGAGMGAGPGPQGTTAGDQDRDRAMEHRFDRMQALMRDMQGSKDQDRHRIMLQQHMDEMQQGVQSMMRQGNPDANMPADQRVRNMETQMQAMQLMLEQMMQHQNQFRRFQQNQP